MPGVGLLGFCAGTVPKKGGRLAVVGKRGERRYAQAYGHRPTIRGGVRPGMARG